MVGTGEGHLRCFLVSFCAAGCKNQSGWRATSNRSGKGWERNSSVVGQRPALRAGVAGSIPAASTLSFFADLKSAVLSRHLGVRVPSPPLSGKTLAHLGHYRQGFWAWAYHTLFGWCGKMDLDGQLFPLLPVAVSTTT